MTAPVNFTGSCTYNWTNSDPSIGLPATGTGNISSFTAVNTGSTAVTATITAAPPPAGFAYIPNAASGTLSIIDLSTNKVISTITLGGFPQGVCVSPDGSKVYITDQANGNIFILNTATNKITGKISADVGIYGIVCSPDGSTLYVGNLGNNIIKLYNTSTYNLVQSVSIVNSAVGMAISNDGKNVYVANSSSGVSKINTVTNSVTNIPDEGGNPYDVAVSPDNNTLYVANKASSNVSVINTTTNLVTKIIPVGHNPFGIVVSPDGSHVYVSDYSDNTVSVIDAATLQVTLTISVGDEPYGMSITSDGSLLYVANVLSSNVSVINTQTNKVTTTTLVESYPEAVGNFILNTPTNCPPVKFNITVKPSSLTPTITTGPVSGTISTCAGNPSIYPEIQQFSVSGANLTGDIVVTPPAGFELSNSIDGTYGSITLMQTSGSVASTTVYVRATGIPLIGNVSGNVDLNSYGATDQFVTVTGLVRPVSMANTPGPQEFANGTQTKPVIFSGTANSYTWTNDNPAIGLAADGSGDIPSFIATNTGTTKITANIMVTPVILGLAYIVNNRSSSVSIINTATQKVINTLPLTELPYSIAVSPGGQQVYIGNLSSSSVTVINTATNASVNVPSIASPIGICVSPDNSRFYIASNTLGIVYVYNVGSTVPITGITVGKAPDGMIISPDGRTLYVVNSGDNNIDVINTLTDKIINTISTNKSPGWIAVSPGGNTLYVTNFLSNNLSVINASTGSAITSISTGSGPSTIAISPDGSRVYVVNELSSSVSVINTTSNQVITTVNVGDNPLGISITNDGSQVYVANNGSGTVSVINTSNYVVTPITVGLNPTSFGNFIAPVGCEGPNTSFTITVDPAAIGATITAPAAATGTITACAGTPSADPNVQQFNVSGTGLTGNITVTAPAGFEVSRDIDGSYSPSVTITPTSGSVGSSLIYVRSSATAPAGPISNVNVTVSSPGATDQLVALSGTIYAIPSANTPASQTKINGQSTDPVNFTGNATSYTWVNNNTSIGLAASGSGNIPSFTAINNTSSPIIATITVTPVNGADCDGTPDEFYITVYPTPPVLTVTGTLTPLTTVYGTPSAAESFTVSCSAVGSAILVMPPAGFEVSSDGTTYSSTVTITAKGSGSASPVYIRLAATTPVGNNYGGDVTVSTANVTAQQIIMSVSTVTPAPLTITADNKTKPVGAVNPPLTLTYSGFVNNDDPANLTSPPVLSTTATILSAVGQYPITISGAASPEYDINYVQGILTVTPSLDLQDIPNTFTPNGDGRNDTWVINGLQYYPIATVNIFNRWGQKLYYSQGYPIPWDGTYHGKALPSGTYYYIIDLRNGQPLIAGWVAIIR